MKSTVTVKHKSKSEAVIKALQTLQKSSVEVGYAHDARKNERKGADITNAQLAYIHEHGSPLRGLPARPFLVPGVKSKKSAWVSKLKGACQAALSGEEGSVTRLLEQAGSVARSAVQNYIRTAPFTPLKDTTIRKRLRGKSRGEREAIQPFQRPLQDTGAMRDAVDYRVRRR